MVGKIQKWPLGPEVEVRASTFLYFPKYSYNLATQSVVCHATVLEMMNRRPHALFYQNILTRTTGDGCIH